MLIRAATDADIPAIEALTITMFPAIRQRLATLSTAAVVELMIVWRQAHPKPTEGIFVAEDAGRIVGTLFVDYSEAVALNWWQSFRVLRQHLKWWKALQVAYILAQAHYPIQTNEVYLNGVAIDPAYRRLGLGEQLTLQAEEYARKQNKRVSTVLIAPSNTASQNLVQKLGYTLCGPYVPFWRRILRLPARALRWQKELV